MNISLSITKELAEIIGLLCAEGCHIVSYSTYEGKNRGKFRIYKNKKSERIEFYNKDSKLLLHFKKLMATCFNYDAKITSSNKINIGKRDIIKSLIGFTNLENTKWRVPAATLSGNKINKMAFVRGYFDGDGTVSNRVRFFQ